MGMDVEKEIQGIKDSLANQFKEESCPNCNESSLLVRISGYNRLHRCMNCLAILNFVKKFEVVEPVCVKLGEE